MLDHAAYHVVYVDTRMSRGLDGKHIQKASPAASETTAKHQNQSWEEYNPDCLKAIIGEIEEVRTNLKRLLANFNGVHTCTCEKSCMANLRRLDNASPSPNPTIVFSGTTFERDSVDPENESSPDPEGLVLLRHLSHEVSKANLSNLIIPVAVVHSKKEELGSSHLPSKPNQIRPSSGGLSALSQKSDRSKTGASKSTSSHQTLLRCVDAGALDVLESPLQEVRLQSLIVRAYRSHRDALHEQALALERKRSRKLSWLGNSENKPYAYLREKMVSDLMTGICNPDEHFHLGNAKPLPALEPTREEQLKRAIGCWSYWGHEYSEDELVHAARFMLQHALSLHELENWRVPSEKLTSFLMASRAAYNDFVEYHNFRHVIDVMQATFFFLIQLGILPEYPSCQRSSGAAAPKSPIASLLRPLDALTMLITALGHDVGHPGVNNAFLVSLNAPLAQLYNDRSVLEAFHCAAYSQILRRYWRVAFEDSDMRSLMINSILATDMGVHQKYMTDLGNLQDKLRYQQGLAGFNTQQLEEYRVLTCALLIKCADISNVARPYEVAVRWANILQLEFANQGVMEQDVGIPTTLFGGPPELGNLIKLGQSQKSFMSFFAQPLFESVADILPAMDFTVDELKKNQTAWAERIQAENEKQSPSYKSREPSSGALSPRSQSPERSSSQPELSLAEGLPASNPSQDALLNMSLPQPVVTSQARKLSGSSAGGSRHGLGDQSLQSDGQLRRSSHTHPLKQSSAVPDATPGISRRSSGAYSSASISNTMLAPRRTSNSSPCQLQLAPDSRSLSNAFSMNTENRMPNDRASEDTLSQICLANGTSSASDPHSTSEAASVRPESKGNDLPRTNASITSRVSAEAPYEHRGHNRSSSGAHTNNTNVSQSTPYSPTGTQATSMLTMDSDSKSAHGRMDSWPERNGPPTLHNLQRPGSSHGPAATSAPVSLGTKDTVTKTMGSGNGSLNGYSDFGHRSIRSRSSRFNIFHSWKRRGNRSESSS